MLLRQTENLPDHAAIDAVDAISAAQMMIDGQISAVQSVAAASDKITQAAQVMADTIANGGTLIYAAAGSSGLMALADVCELPGTFGIQSHQLRLHMAGGVPGDGHMPGQTEDDTDTAEAIAAKITKADCLIALSASGSTPYPVAIAEKAAALGASVISIANNPDTPLLNIANIAIYLSTPPEVLAGSTRLGAGTAQKIALNIMSTLMGVHLGHVYRGRMVNLIADNAKLLDRAVNIVCEITEVPEHTARAALESAGGDVKIAIMIASGMTLDHAQKVLTLHKGQLGPCLTPND
jgi:N-acetylmuramic acid 6-phosphate etherase